jgi:cytochrome c
MIRFSLVAIGFLLALTACAHSKRAGEPKAADRGHALAQDLCAGCHAIEPRGASPLAAAPAFRDSLAKYADDRLERDLQSGVLMGHPALPTVKLSSGGAHDLMAYLKSLRAPDSN